MKRVKKMIMAFLVIPMMALASLSTGCGEEDNFATVVDAIAANDDLSILFDLLEDSGLDTTLANVGPFTVFAPINNAFSDEILAAFETDPVFLTDTLENHVVEGRFDEDDLRTIADEVDNTLTTLNGTDLTVTLDPEDNIVVFVQNSALVIETDIEADNGVVHKINALLAD